MEAVECGTGETVNGWVHFWIVLRTFYGMESGHGMGVDVFSKIPMSAVFGHGRKPGTLRTMK